MAEEGRDSPPQVLGGNAQQELKAFAERIGRLEEEKAALAEDIKTVYGEAAGSGFDTKALRKAVKELAMDAAARASTAEQEAILETYRHALGLLSDLPLGVAAIEAKAREERKKKPRRKT